eukprot:SAG11_NODE_38535_length_252_cov_0.549020_1_plen_45_part_10
MTAMDIVEESPDESEEQGDHDKRDQAERDPQPSPNFGLGKGEQCS